MGTLMLPMIPTRDRRIIRSLPASPPAFPRPLPYLRRLTGLSTRGGCVRRATRNGKHLGRCPRMLRSYSTMVAPLRRRSGLLSISLAMGLGSCGRPALKASPLGCGHSMSRSMRVPNDVAPARTVNAVSRTRRCVFRSLGIPNGCPNGNSTPTTRGANCAIARFGIVVTTTVGIPALSIHRANTGTFRQQSGHIGASTTPSASCSFNALAMAGAVSFRHLSRELSCQPW